MTVECVDIACPKFVIASVALSTVIARSVSDEAIQSLSTEGLWIASLRSQ